MIHRFKYLCFIVISNNSECLKLPNNLIFTDNLSDLSYVYAVLLKFLYFKKSSFKDSFERSCKFLKYHPVVFIATCHRNCFERSKM